MEQFEQWLHGVLKGKAPGQAAPVESQSPVKPKVQVIAEPKPVPSGFGQKKGLVSIAAAMGLIGIILLIMQFNTKPASVKNPSQPIATTSTQQPPAQIPKEVKPSEVEIQQWIKNGYAYFSGEGVQQDYKQAFEWFKKAAEQGNVEAQNWVGVMYGKGKGTSRDEQTAVYWYLKAAEQGNPKAAFNLGVRYSEGHGVSVDHSESDHWFRVGG